MRRKSTYPPDSGYVDLNFKVDAVYPEKVLGVHFNDGFGAEIQVLESPQCRRGPVRAEFLFQELQRQAVEPDGRRRQGS
ncbi:hypothetical protein GCM10011577_23050 [Pseudarthrobacter polychromogenes]|uniref:DUF2283 domain-containing protein n=1 Tax=Pseudarthrobacter polychromogenes TaxID=1676 RepID=A0ABQ1XP11_9MICC|nr:hypothetical protein GCM10011577_23050 [Pseudarthrobacter polychromogenes]